MFPMVFGIVQCVFLTIDVFGASRQAVFFHVTVACSFLSTSLAAVVGMYVAHACFCSRGVGWGRVTNNVPDDFKTVGHKGPCNFLFLFLFLLLLLLTCCTRSLAYAQQGGGGGVITLLMTLTLLAKMAVPFPTSTSIRRPAGGSCGSCLFVVVLSVLSFSLFRLPPGADFCLV